MEAVHQGYLLCSVVSSQGHDNSGTLQKVYVVMTHNELVCYSENPAQQNFSKVQLISSMSLKTSKIVESTRNPKSFELVSTRDNSKIELSCPTNSVKFQWMKHLQVQTCAAAVVPLTSGSGTSGNRIADQHGMDERQRPSAVSRTSPTRDIAANTPPVSKLTASRNLAAKVLTPVPRISYNTSMLDHSLGGANHLHLDSSGQSQSLHNTAQSQELGNSGKFVPEEMPKWIPGNFGNNKHSSLALSPSPPRSRSAGRIQLAAPDSGKQASHPGPAVEYRFRDARSQDEQANPPKAKANVSRQRGRQNTSADYDVLNSRAAPTRPASVNAIPRKAVASSPRGSTAQNSSRRAAEAIETERTQTLRTTQSTPRERREHPREYAAEPSPAPAMDLMAKSMNSMTVAEIKAALMNMPEMVRHSLMDVNTPNSTMGTLHDTQARSRAHQDRDRGRDRETPGHDQSASRHRSHNNSSMMEYYNSHRKEGERYEHFMGEGYPAVGEFYPYEDGDASGAEISSADESSDHDQIGEQEGSFADSSYLDGTEDAQVYRPATARGSGRAAAAPDSRTESEFDEEADGYGAYSSDQNFPDQDFHRSSRRQSAPAAERYHEPPGGSSSDARGRSIKPQLPPAARRASVTSSGAESESPRGSGIPRPVKAARPVEEPTLARKASHRQNSPSRNQEAARKQDQGRARSAQRLPAGRPSRDPPAQESLHRSSSANTAERSRYLNEPERREAVEWSRKQAWERKVRSDFSGSPLRAASPGNAPPLKLKYRSFHNSLEKVDESEVPNRERNGEAKQPRHSAGHQNASAAVNEAVRAIAHNRTRDGVVAESAAGRAPASQVRQVADTARASGAQSPPRNSFSKKPESFFDFKQNRAGSNGRPSQAPAAGGVRHAMPSSHEHGDELPLPSKSVSPGRSHRPSHAAADVNATRGRPDAARASANENVTNVAEWRRLAEWLARIDMTRYIDVLKANGITKLSLVELMQPSDMRQIGIDAQDIPVILNNVNEFTNRTRSFSEQVLNKPVSAASSPTSSYDSAPRHPSSGPAAPASTAAAPPSMSVLQTKKAIGPPPTRPLFVPQPKEGSAPAVAARTKPLKPPYSSVLSRAAAVPIVPAELRPSKPSRPAVAPLVIDGDAGMSKGGGVDEHIFSDMDEIINELYRCFESGERELFFHAWKQAALYMPDDCMNLNPARPAMFNARQVIEFHLHLHFAVYPITHHQGKKAEKLGKLALQRYLESVMLTSELDSFNQVLPVKQFSPTAKGADISASEEDILKMNTTISSFPSPSSGRPFTRTREYAVYAGIVLVPEPEQNVAFQGLFQPHWMESLKERLRQFLQLVRPHVEIISTVANSVVSEASASGEAVQAEAPIPSAALVEDVQNVPALDLASEAGSSFRSGREKVRKYLHVKDMAPETAAPATPGGLDDFGIAFSSPEVAAKDEGAFSSPVPVADEGAFSSPVPAAQAPVALQEAPLAAETVSKGAVVPPLDFSSASAAEVNAPAGAQRDHDDSAAVGRISRIASPVSPVSSVISQLTDDSPRPSGPTSGAVLSPVTPNSSERKGKLKPFGASSKAGMQSQVDSYNKLLRHGAAADNGRGGADGFDADRPDPVSQLPLPASAVHASDLGKDAVVVGAQPPKALAVTRRGSAQPAGNRAPSLNLGFGMKRRSASDASASAPSQSLAAQVAKYNKLLLSKNGADVDAGQASALQSASQDDEAAEEITPAQAQQVADVLVEMQDIYETQAQENGRRSSAFFAESDGPVERHPVAPLAE